MKILQIHTKMVSGGIEAIVCGLVNQMSNTEDVTLCTIFKPSFDDVFLKKVSANVKKVTIGKLKIGFSIIEIFKIFNLIRKGKYDVVHVHGCFQYYFLSMLLLHKKSRFFYTIHSDAQKENQVWDWRLFKLKRFLFTHRWVVPVTISEISQKSFYNLYQCSSELIYNGTPKGVYTNSSNIIDSLRITSNTKVFVHAGRICEPKNQIVLCKVFEKLINEGKDVVLVIAGSAEDTNIFNDLKVFFSDRIIYLGERDDIPELFHRSDAFCLPSVWEGLPVTLLEALSVGCIPICSPVGGIANVIISGENGLLSKDSSQDSYYHSIIQFLNMNEKSILTMKNKALDSFKKYDIVTCSNNYLYLYKTC